MKKLVALLAVLIGLWAVQGFAFAQSTDQPAATQTQTQDAKPFDKKRLMVPPKNADGSVQVTPFLQDPVMWVRDQQQVFFGAMNKTMRDLKGESAMAAAWSLMLLSLGYGVFHAAGPGHGKTVISGWLLATENELKRGVLVAFMSAIIQALVAIALVSGALLLLNGASAAAKNAAGYLESTSYALIALMGLYLLWTGLKPFLKRKPMQPASVGAAAVTSSHHFEIVNHLPPVHDHGLDDHVHGPDCGHAHAPLPSEVSHDWSWKQALSLSFAVGVRPCTGAILVLLFANAMGIYWAGVISTFVMAIGTFATVAVIAAIAVYFKKLANGIAARDGKWLERLNTTLRIGGGVAIAALGVMLFIAALSGSLPDTF